MTQDQPPTSPHPDPEDESPPAAKSAEDRKAAAALSKLDTHDDETAPAREVDQEAVKNAMSALGGPTPGKTGGGEKKEVKKVKVDAGDVALLVCLSPPFRLHIVWFSLAEGS